MLIFRRKKNNLTLDAGKRWVANKLVAMHEDKFGLVISHTTRPPRAGEQDNVDYIFTDREAVEIGKVRHGESLGLKAMGLGLRI